MKHPCVARAILVTLALSPLACGTEPPTTKPPQIIRFCDRDYQLDDFGVVCDDPNVVGASVLRDLSALHILSLSDTSISELPPLRHVSQIEMLDLSGTRIRDLSMLNPAEWENLQVLILNDTSLTDLGPVANLPALVSLEVRNTRVTDLSPAFSNPTVERIWASGTPITALPSMAGARSLEFLDVSYSLLDDISGVRDAPALTKLRMSTTLVRDLAPLAATPRLTHVTAADTLASVSAVAELREARPALEILHYKWYSTPAELRAYILEWPLRGRTSVTLDAGTLDAAP